MLVEEIHSLLLLLRTPVGMRNNYEYAGFLLNQIFLPPLFRNRVFSRKATISLGKEQVGKSLSFYHKNR